MICRASSAAPRWSRSPARARASACPRWRQWPAAQRCSTTHRTALPEVGGDAVAYTEPDADSIKAALQALLEDPDRRTALGDAGYARAMEFSWAASAEAHMISYERAAAQAVD